LYVRGTFSQDCGMSRWSTLTTECSTTRILSPMGSSERSTRGNPRTAVSAASTSFIIGAIGDETGALAVIIAKSPGGICGCDPIHSSRT